MDTRYSRLVGSKHPTFILFIPLVALLLSFFSADTRNAIGATTSDGLSLSVLNGRVTSLSINGHTPQFCAPGTGGFYIRDYTINEQTGLPENLDSHGNLMDCTDFETDCLTCLDLQGTWTFSSNQVPPDISCAFLTYPSSGTTTAAKIVHPTDLTGPYFIGMYQDIYLSESQPPDDLYPDPDTNDLFCFSFDLATACGYRSRTHPEDTETYHGNHKILARIEWYEDIPPTGSDVFTPSTPTAGEVLAYTEAEAWESSGIVSPDGEILDRFTPIGIRSYRPRNADYVRVGVIVQGYMPNTGVDNAAYFDNFAFYKAPPMVHVRTDGSLLTGNDDFSFVRKVTGELIDPGLKMKASLTTVSTDDGDYLLISGSLKNQDSTLFTMPERTLDLGFALPISATAQELTWWDDLDNKEVIDPVNNVNTLPIRMAGPIDSRPKQTVAYYCDNYPNDTREQVSLLRSENIQVSAYPYSALMINMSNYRRGLSFGDDLDSDTVQISHYGYRVFHPEETFSGWYYVEFRLGLLPEDAGGTRNETPFSFILFRGDNPDWVEASVFREATNRYQTDFFQSSDYFARPFLYDHSEYEWSYGGGFYQAYVEDVGGQPALVSNTFNNNANEYGLRYTQEFFLDKNHTDIARAIDLLYGIGVDAVIYEQPWTSSFHNPLGNCSPINLSNPLSLSHNHRSCIQSNKDQNNYDPQTDPPYFGPIWSLLYDAKESNSLTIPIPTTTDCIDLIGHNVESFAGISSTKEKYFFPCLTVSDDIGDADLIEAERSYIAGAYESLIDEFSDDGLKGMTLDNMFYGKHMANHLDFSPARLPLFVDSGGSLTYSINHLSPAIPQVAANVLLMEGLREELENIENTPGSGDGTETEQPDEELLSVNANEPLYGASKHGIMHSDIGGFESSTTLGLFNRSVRSQNFRRTNARDKNMSRLLSKILIRDCIIENWQYTGQCDNWDNLWGPVNHTDFEIQLVAEASWMSLAWGFMPSISNIFSDIDDVFFTSHILPLFDDQTIPPPVPPPGKSFTGIFKELHLSGWRPITNATVSYDGVVPEQGLRVERFGDFGRGDASTIGESLCFTALNNDDLSLTVLDLARFVPNGDPAEKSIDEIETAQEYRDYGICEKDFGCDNFPGSCPSELKEREKSVRILIQNLKHFDLVRAGNIVCRQLVHSPDKPTVCNWPSIEEDEFGVGPSYNGENYSLEIITILGLGLRIGGPWDKNNTHQDYLSIPDKALMVFKVWLEEKVDNGDGGEEGRGSSRTGDSDTAVYIGDHYELYGDGWQRYDTAGYNGDVDVVSVSDPTACAYYTFTSGESATIEAMVHFPISSLATTAAQYDVYVTDYFVGLAGDTNLGSPVLTTVIDQSDADAYSAAANEDGFISIGTFDVSVEDPAFNSIIVKVSVPGSSTQAREPSRLLVSDVVMLKTLE